MTKLEEQLRDDYGLRPEQALDLKVTYRGKRVMVRDLARTNLKEFDRLMMTTKMSSPSYAGVFYVYNLYEQRIRKLLRLPVTP